VMNNRIRIGKFGRRYYQHRFRVYRMDADERIAAGLSPYTVWGRFLRSSHIDGLPQIIDVFNGDMSFIGPRSPSLTGFLSYTPEQISNLCCKPGIVGYWSCQTDIRDITEDDRAYVESWNFFRECGILLESVIRYVTLHSTRKFYKQYLAEWKQEELELIRDYKESIRPLEYDRKRYKARDGASYKAYLIIKRAFDIVASLAAIILLSIPLLVLIILVIADDGGAPFYGHSRIGLRGKRIRVFKFRSMRSDAGNLEKLLTPEQLRQYWTEFKVDNDPRITKIGNFLRKTSLDELPQLYNILKGDLSVVGPRPIVEKETKIYGDEIGKLLSVKPGLTGYWQAYARNNATYESGERQKMEMYYVDHCSLLLDIKIIFRTVFSVLKREGAK
ncbi:MAG: sugar transferase, partial [bacterium]